MNPALHPVAHGEIREALLRRHPYAIYYLAEPDLISLLAVYHTARDPANWQQRV